MTLIGLNVGSQASLIFSQNIDYRCKLIFEFLHLEEFVQFIYYNTNNYKFKTLLTSILLFRIKMK